MTEVKTKQDEPRKKSKDDLPEHWRKVHGAIWLLGLAVLFATGNIFPGILVLVALSSLLEVGMRAYLSRQQETVAVEQARERHLPENCPSCGGPLSTANVKWNGPHTATCPFCGSSVKAIPDA